jgi:hypothetical protein
VAKIGQNFSWKKRLPGMENNDMHENDEME